MDVKRYVCSVFEACKTERLGDPADGEEEQAAGEPRQAIAGAAGKHTMEEVWKVLCWSYKALYSGEWPHTDADGNAFPLNTSDALLAGHPLADGYCAVIWAIKGDLEWWARGLKLRHHAADKFCVRCSDCRLLCQANLSQARPGKLALTSLR